MGAPDLPTGGGGMESGRESKREREVVGCSCYWKEPWKARAKRPDSDSCLPPLLALKYSLILSGSDGAVVTRERKRELWLFLCVFGMRNEQLYICIYSHYLIYIFA
ncbi:hypothetical protein AVEN_157673-1 [Araneus ventricosus]|uniref:Uncharacterized protein n=1 Tax=Araneus ventricosus TaxID=182803 RepID=A0A4Y2UVM5_ARAVE|nr:hypothetical protein AVEN_157673-1 [Araneus ventricosus]